MQGLKRKELIPTVTVAKIEKATKSDVVDFIDLCSSDEEGEFILSTDYEPQQKKFKIDPEEDNSVIQLGKEIANCGGEIAPVNLNDQPFELSDLLTHNNNNNTSNNNNIINHQALRPLPSVFLFSNNIENSGSRRQSTESSNFCLNKQENLSAIKENRVNDWLNETSASIEVPAIQALPIISTVSSLSPTPQSLSPSLQHISSVATTPNTNSKRSLPQIAKLTSEPARHRAITANAN